MIHVINKMIRLNGLRWTSYVVLYVILRKFSKDLRIAALDRKIKSLEKRKNLPGINSREVNTLIWNTWKWKKTAGEEWAKSSGWKQSLIDDVMNKNIAPGNTILEIGPGAGKWTEPLQQIAQELIVVDISEKSIEVCKQRFSHCPNIRYFVNDGSGLSFLPHSSIDYIWSFDVFFHIAPPDIEAYTAEFARILKPGGRGIIHHAGEGGLHGGWRSTVTRGMMQHFLENQHLKLITQFDSWGEDGRYDVKLYHDVITIFEKT